MGRKPLGERAMSNGERMKRMRAKRKADYRGLSSERKLRWELLSLISGFRLLHPDLTADQIKYVLDEYGKCMWLDEYRNSGQAAANRIADIRAAHPNLTAEQENILRAKYSEPSNSMANFLFACRSWDFFESGSDLGEWFYWMKPQEQWSDQAVAFEANWNNPVMHPRYY